MHLYANTNKKSSQNFKDGRRISLYDSLPFIFERFPDQEDSQCREIPLKVPHQKVAKPTKSVSFFKSKTNRLPHDSFHTKQQQFTLSSTAAFKSQD